MSTYQIFVRNVAPVVTAEDLADLFSAYGQVVDVKRPFDHKKQQPQLYAFVRMGTDDEALAAIAGLANHPIGGMNLDVRKAEPPSERKPKEKGKPRDQKPQASGDAQQGGKGPKGDKGKAKGKGQKDGKRPFKKKQKDPVRDANWKHALEIAEVLGESAKRPRAQIARIVELKGTEFADGLLADTQRIEELGGMLTLDGERRRTIGGVFFKLAKDRLDDETRHVIFPNWRELKRRADERKKREKEEAAKPKGQKPAGDKPPSATAPKRTVSKPKVAAGTGTPTPEIREELARLREAERVAKQRLEDIKAKRVKGGMLEAMKELADLKARILQIEQAYPSLK